MQQRNEKVMLAAPLAVESIVKNYGRGKFVAAEEAASVQEALFPGLSAVFADCGLSSHKELQARHVKALIRTGFRHPPAGSGVDAALTHLAALNRLRNSSACNTVTISSFRDAIVKVSVSTLFLPAVPEQLMAAASHWPFAYRVRIENVGTATAVQLLSRHWRFEDQKGGVIEVPRGSAGVVGLAPVLEPGSCFEYVSGTQLGSPNGTMQGGFQMVIGRTDEKFEASAGKTELRGPTLKAGSSEAASAATTKVTSKSK
jgi:ApaG protein